MHLTKSELQMKVALFCLDKGLDSEVCECKTIKDIISSIKVRKIALIEDDSSLTFETGKTTLKIVNMTDKVTFRYRSFEEEVVKEEATSKKDLDVLLGTYIKKLYDDYHKLHYEM